MKPQAEKKDPWRPIDPKSRVRLAIAWMAEDPKRTIAAAARHIGVSPSAVYRGLHGVHGRQHKRRCPVCSQVISTKSEIKAVDQFLAEHSKDEAP